MGSFPQGLGRWFIPCPLGVLPALGQPRARGAARLGPRQEEELKTGGGRAVAPPQLLLPIRAQVGGDQDEQARSLPGGGAWAPTGEQDLENESMLGCHCSGYMPSPGMAVVRASAPLLEPQ